MRTAGKPPAKAITLTQRRTEMLLGWLRERSSRAVVAFLAIQMQTLPPRSASPTCVVTVGCLETPVTYRFRLLRCRIAAAGASC